MLKDQFINGIIDREGGYVNDPDDHGGETNWGVTVAVARAYGYVGPMKDMPRTVAYHIYSKLYWDVLHLDAIEALSPRLAEELADTGVNMGVARAAEFLQRCLNALNNQQKDYKDMPVDGKIGKKTLEVLQKYMAKRGVRGELVLFRALNCLQGAKYITLAETRQTDEKFLFGWLLNRVS